MKSIVIVIGYLFLNHEGYTVHIGFTRTPIIELFQIRCGNGFHQRQIGHQWNLWQQYHTGVEW